MTGQETPLPKKRRGPKPTGWGRQIVVRMHSPLLGKLDDWIKAQPLENAKPISRAEAVRRLLDKALKEEGE